MLKERCQLYASLYVSCQSRRGNLDDFFSHMNHEYPPSISEYGKIRKPTSKSDFLSCLPKDVITFERPLVDAYVIDGPAFVHMNTPKMSSTYGEYC